MSLRGVQTRSRLSEGPSVSYAIQTGNVSQASAAEGRTPRCFRSFHRPSGFVAVLYALFAAATVAGQVNQTLGISKENRTITVSATDQAFALADQAVVHVGYEAYGADEGTAYMEGSRRSNAVISALRSAGVQADSLESEDQNLQPLNDYELKNLAPALKGMRYRITQSWTVRTAPDTAAKVLDTAVKAGANQSGNIGWEMKDGAMLEAQASAKALAHAQAIAARMAEGLRIKIGPLLYASNQAQASPIRPMMLAMAPKAKMADEQPISIVTRRVERSATVFAIFAIE